MYSTKFLYTSVFNTPFVRPNLHISLNVKNACSEQYVFKCVCTLRDISASEISNYMNNVITKVQVCKKGSLYRILSQHLRLTPNKLKDQSTIIIRAWTRQCEYIVAQRFRRTQQMFCLYTRLWEERALRELLKRMKQQITQRSKEFVFGAIGITAFNWDSCKISDQEIYTHMNEFDYIHLLQSKTIVCKQCRKERLVDIMLPDKTYCKCPCNSTGNESYTLDSWAPFLERNQLLVWRRQHNNSGIYEYKLYGAYDDVTAHDFLQVQINTEFRTTWDTSAVKLYVIESDASTNSDIIYWEMLWPRMFTNRDYVFNRRYNVDREHNLITILSKSVEHPDCPVKPDKIRIHTYESCMVIRPTSDINQPGIEFSLTYYDDPGVNIPAAVQSWVAIAGMPDFLSKLRHAAKAFHEKYGGSDLPDPPTNIGFDSEVVDGLPRSTRPDIGSEESVHPVSAVSESDSGPGHSSSYWRYIHPYYYLG